jgi:cysteine desulfurase
MARISRKIYLDYAATTPVDPRVVKAMLPYFSEKFGNTMSLHAFGQEAKGILEESREKVANLMGAKPSEIFFTGSATESNNLALKGISESNKKKGHHIIISQIEHPCVRESAAWLESQGLEVTRLKVDKYGLVNPRDVEKALRKDTILVSIIHASNEIGTIEPIGEIGKICREKKIYFHKGDIVLDPFIGSGTTAIACLDQNRHYIGIEAMENYYKLAQESIDNWKANNNGDAGKVSLWT